MNKLIVNVISKNKDKNVNEYNQFLRERIIEKFKKNYDANTYIKQIEEKRKQIKEKQKIEQLRLFDLKKEKVQRSIEKLKEKENKKWNEVKSNLEMIENNQKVKNDQLFEKINIIQSRPKDYFSRRVEEFKLKRQRSLEKYQQNSEKINNIIEEQNEKLLKHYQKKVIKSTQKARSIDVSKQNVRYLNIGFYFL